MQEEKPKIIGWSRYVTDVTQGYWLPLLYQVFLVGVLIAIGNLYAHYHRVDLLGFLTNGAPLSTWDYVGDKSTAMLIEAFIAASVGVTIRAVGLPANTRHPFILLRSLRSWLVDFVQIPFTVTVLVILLRAPGLNFDGKFLSLSTTNISFVWAMAAIAGYFSVETRDRLTELHGRFWGGDHRRVHSHQAAILPPETETRAQSTSFEAQVQTEDGQLHGASELGQNSNNRSGVDGRRSSVPEARDKTA